MARHGSPQLKNIARSVGEHADWSRHAAMLSRQMDLTLAWKDLDWARRHWSGKVIVKGVMSVDDALLAVKAAMAGFKIWPHEWRC
jgi:(S)-mandelate dehydrogenase